MVVDAGHDWPCPVGLSRMRGHFLDMSFGDWRYLSPSLTDGYWDTAFPLAAEELPDAEVMVKELKKRVRSRSRRALAEGNVAMSM